MSLHDQSIAARMERRELRHLSQHTGAFDPGLRIDIESYEHERSDAEVAFVVPVFNQERHISLCLQSIVEHASAPFELVVIADAPTDATVAAVRRWYQEVRATSGADHFLRFTLAQPEASIFETQSDTIGIALSTAPTIIEVQADMQVEEPGFDVALHAWFAQVPDLLAVSGRGAHSFDRAVDLGIRRRALTARAIGRLTAHLARARHHYRPTTIEHALGDGIGRIGPLVDVPAARPGKPTLFLHETIMRGPYALDRKRFQEVGGFDTERFFLGNDDHDLAVRAWRDFGYRVGYSPVVFSSPLELGTTRRTRSAEEQRAFDALRDHYAEASLTSALLTRRSNDRRPPRSRVSSGTDSGTRAATV